MIIKTIVTRTAEKKLLKVLKRVLLPHQFEFYRGDSFQVYIKNAGDALKTALLCRAVAIGIGEIAAAPSDVRISIGIGKVKGTVTALGTAKGDAFVLSGRGLDELTKNNSRLAIASNNKLASQGLEVIADYINSIFKNMTGKQAGVIFELLKGESQRSVATKLKKSNSTINSHVNAGRWPEIERLLQQYENIINQLT